MQREEKQMDATIDAVLNRLTDIKGSISALLFKLDHEHETINWPAFLDNFALISGHVSMQFHLSVPSVLFCCCDFWRISNEYRPSLFAFFALIHHIPYKFLQIFYFIHSIIVYWLIENPGTRINAAATKFNRFTVVIVTRS